MKDEIRFLIQCYFGSEGDPILIAIDRAYRDMATHTLYGDAEKELYPGRKIVTEYFYGQINVLTKDHTDFDLWHEETSRGIKAKYQTLTYGQIQKWINMTIKYLYTLRKLGVDGVDVYFGATENVKKFHAPLDSYVLNAIDEPEPTWSNIETYETYKERVGKISFWEEYKNWPQYARESMLKKDGEPKLGDKGTYKRFVHDNGGYNFR